MMHPHDMDPYTAARPTPPDLQDDPLEFNGGALGTLAVVCAIAVVCAAALYFALTAVWS